MSSFLTSWQILTGSVPVAEDQQLPPAGGRVWPRGRPERQHLQDPVLLCPRRTPRSWPQLLHRVWHSSSSRWVPFNSFSSVVWNSEWSKCSSDSQKSVPDGQRFLKFIHFCSVIKAPLLLTFSSTLGEILLLWQPLAFREGYAVEPFYCLPNLT